jgi:hypothetical protein
MALSNWDTLAVDLNGEPCNGSYTSPLGIVVSIYKNWVYVYDAQAWHKDGQFVEPCVMQFQHGEIVYKDVNLQFVRGPQEGIYGACWHEQCPEKGPTIYTGFIGCGVYGFDGDKWVGVLPSSFDFLRRIITHTEPMFSDDEILDWLVGLEGEKRTAFEAELRVSRTGHFPEPIAAVSLGKAQRFNQGDEYFAQHLGAGGDAAAIVATEVGKADPTLLSELVTKLQVPNGQEIRNNGLDT